MAGRSLPYSWEIRLKRLHLSCGSARRESSIPPGDPIHLKIVVVLLICRMGSV